MTDASENPSELLVGRNLVGQRAAGDGMRK